MANEPRQQPRRTPADRARTVRADSERTPDGRHRDGRLERRRRNRHAVLDAYLTLTEAGSADPTMEQLADLAGVSHRSVFRYFDDRTALVVAVAERVTERLTPVVTAEPRPADPLDVRITAFVDRRVRGYELIGPTAARVAARCEDLAPASLVWSRRLTIDEVERHFAPELLRLDSHRRDAIVRLAAAPFQHLALHELASSSSDARQSLAQLLTIHLTSVLNA